MRVAREIPVRRRSRLFEGGTRDADACRMKLSRIISSAVGLGLLALASRAEAAASSLPGAKRLRLAQALAYAREHQPALAAARSRLEAARHEALANDREWYPKVTVGAQLVGASTNPSSATTLSMSGLNVARVGGTRLADPPSLKPYASTLVGIGIRQEVFDFGRLSAEATVLDGLVRLERAQSELADLDVAFLTTSAYYAVLASHQVLSAAESAHARASAHRDLAEAGTRTGLRPPIDLTRADADVARFEVGRARAEGGVRTARSVLAAILGAPEPEIDAEEEAQVPSPLPSAEDAARRASTESPAVQRAEAVLRVQTARVDEVSARTRPRIYLDGALDARGGGYAGPDGPRAVGAGFVPQVPNYDLGVVFVWPLWEPSASEHEKAARARRSAAEDDLRGARVAAVQEARRERLRVAIAERTLEALERAVAAAKANGEQAEARFGAGLGTGVELSDAEALRVEAELQLVGGHLEWMTARASLARVLSEKP